MNNEVNKKKIAFYTLGCKVNQYETNAMEQKFIESGYETVDFNEKSDIYIVNTCTVTNMSDRKSRQILRRAKMKNPNSIVVAVGCYAQIAKEKLEEIEEIDLILGNNEKKDIVSYIENYINSKYNKIHLEDVLHQNEYLDFGSVTYSEKTRAVIKIQDGCDRFCSYCIIPYARGKIRSRKMENIIKEVEDIAKKGIKEVVITGIHIASYGKDFKGKIKLIDLLENINKIDGIDRTRLTSLETTIIEEEFVTRIKKLKKICHHFHLSLQSGCDETLKRMNRRYTIEQFEKCVLLLRNTYNDVILTTDIIVGFPGETEEEFNITYRFLENIKFYKIHVFKYSVRNGTKAAKMDNQIPENIKEIRSRKLIELSLKQQIEYNESYIEKKVNVLFEDKDGEYFQGHTDNYILVKVKDEVLANQIYNIEIIKKENEYLIGKQILH